MLTIHHLGHSQSERIVWLCEELGIPYELRHYHRDAVTRACALRESMAQVRTSDDAFDVLVRRSVADLTMMLTPKPEGLYPYAGVPWFSTVFGRDGIVTAMQTLVVAPQVALGVLRHLAATPATATAPERDAGELYRTAI